MRSRAEIKNQPWPMAFQAILASQGLSAQEMAGGIIRVDEPSALAALDSLEPLETSVVRVNYAQAGALTKTLEGILTKGRGRVVADTATNSLIITDTRSRIDRASPTSCAGWTSDAAGLDPGQDHLRGSDRHRGSSGSSTTWVTSNQFFNKLVQRTDPSTGEPYEPDVNVVDLGGNTLSAIGNADAVITGSALDLVFSTAIGGFSLTTFLSALERSRPGRHPGRAGHHHAGQPAGRHPGR